MKLKKYLYKKVESTNNVALRLIKQGNQRGIILTDQQTKGKGRGKNRWISMKGNLFISIFFEITKKISFGINGVNQGVALENINTAHNIDYRLVVSFSHKGSQLTLLKFEHKAQ